MTSSYYIWDGEEWEQRVQLYLKRRYGPGEYVHLPAKHLGDFGIEGFSRDGLAYQCYAAQEPLSTKVKNNEIR